jgi:hypothetical protein
MEEKQTNPSIVRAIWLSVVAIPLGFSGFVFMFASPTPGLYTMCTGGAAICSIAAIISANNGLADIGRDPETQKGKGLAQVSIVLGVVNLLLLMFYFVSY